MSTIINHTSVVVIFAADRDSSIRQRIVNMVSRRKAVTKVLCICRLIFLSQKQDNQGKKNCYAKCWQVLCRSSTIREAVRSQWNPGLGLAPLHECAFLNICAAPLLCASPSSNTHRLRRGARRSTVGQQESEE